MPIYILLAVIFLSSLILTMVGLGGGLIFSPLFVLLGFPISQAVSASLFLNAIAASSAAYTYFRKGLVDFRVALPLLIGSTIAAPVGALLTREIDFRIFSMIMIIIIFLASLRMLFSGKTEPEEIEISTPGKGSSAAGASAFSSAFSRGCWE